MATGFLHADSYVLPYCPLVPLSNDTESDPIEIRQDEIDAAQAVAVYRRVIDSPNGDPSGLDRVDQPIF